MGRERVLKIVLVVTGVLFVGLAIPGFMFFARDPAVPMIMSLYVAMGIFLLMAARDPFANRSLIAYAGWANVAHAAVMTVQAFLKMIQPTEIVGVFMFGIIGIALVMLTPAKPASKQVSSAAA